VGFDEVLDRVASRFSRCETLRNAGALMLGLVSDLGRKNCWTLAERVGHPSPDRLQHLLARAKWDADGVVAVDVHEAHTAALFGYDTRYLRSDLPVSPRVEVLLKGGMPK
jgi:hypothetical protein